MSDSNKGDPLATAVGTTTPLSQMEIILRSEMLQSFDMEPICHTSIEYGADTAADEMVFHGDCEALVKELLSEKVESLRKQGDGPLYLRPIARWPDPNGTCPDPPQEVEVKVFALPNNLRELYEVDSTWCIVINGMFPRNDRCQFVTTYGFDSAADATLAAHALRDMLDDYYRERVAGASGHEDVAMNTIDAQLISAGMQLEKKLPLSVAT